jgi:hemolysin D
MSHALTLRLGATVDLFKRYGAIFRHAWRHRRETDPPKRLAHEAAFLPAALELIDTPVSPAPRVTMWLLMSFALIALLWATFGHIDIVATAQGKIIPNDQVKTVQPLESGIVKRIHVREGQSVNAGDLLVELDPTTTDADRVRIANDVLGARAQAARARALLDALGRLNTGAPSGPATLPGIVPTPTLPPIPGADPARQAQEQRLLDGLWQETTSKLARIDADLQRREAERSSTLEVVRKLEQTAPLAKRRAEDFKNLVSQNFISQHGYLDKEQARIEQEADLATQKSRLKELDAALAEGRSQRLGLIAETRRAALDSLNDGQQKAIAQAQEGIKAEQRGKQTQLIAPVAGTVQQLAIHTVGGVVTPAQALLLIVPKDNPLEIEAVLDNKDIGFVNAGQAAQLKIETFPFTKYGTVPGEVIHVSTDAVADEKRGLVFLARVRPLKDAIQVEQKRVRLSPGMAVTVEIKTGERRVIEYFLSPLMQARDESFRER